MDWAFAGIFPAGDDFADLIGLAAWFRDLAIPDIPRVEAVAFAAYEDSLRSAGWHDDHRLIRVGYAAAVALRLGACMPGWAALMLGPERVDSSQRLFPQPADAILATWIALADIYLDLAEAACDLTKDLELIP